LRRAQGRFEEAEPIYQRVLEIRRKTLGEENTFYATSLNSLAVRCKTGNSC
jgi:hypothetical protein